MPAHNTALHLTAIPLRFIAVSELVRYERQLLAQSNGIVAKVV